jgi:hypothetical protein
MIEDAGLWVLIFGGLGMCGLYFWSALKERVGNLAREKRDAAQFTAAHAKPMLGTQPGVSTRNATSPDVDTSTSFRSNEAPDGPQIEGLQRRDVPSLRESKFASQRSNPPAQHKLLR